MEGIKGGGGNWGNYNSIINKIYFKKEKRNTKKINKRTVYSEENIWLLWKTIEYVIIDGEKKAKMRPSMRKLRSSEKMVKSNGELESSTP